jgi:hypothetical protein
MGQMLVKTSGAWPLLLCCNYIDFADFVCSMRLGFAISQFIERDVGFMIIVSQPALMLEFGC